MKLPLPIQARQSGGWWRDRVDLEDNKLSVVFEDDFLLLIKKPRAMHSVVLKYSDSNHTCRPNCRLRAQ